MLVKMRVFGGCIFEAVNALISQTVVGKLDNELLWHYASTICCGKRRRPQKTRRNCDGIKIRSSQTQNRAASASAASR
jgi:hypothetical protein